jgi:hypothetical protein
VFWLHAQTGANGIFAQRMDASGNRVFPASGIQIVLKPTVGSVYKDAIPDGSGGAIITWSLTAVGDTGVRVQRVDGNGSLAWLQGGVIVSDVVGIQRRPRIAGDGAGGAIIVWEDIRAGGTSKVYAQRVNSNGQTEWLPPDGIPVCGTTPNSQFNPMIVSDGSGGAIIAWEDFRSPPYAYLYAQRLNNLGQRQWPDSGVLVTYIPTSKFLRGVISDGAGGAIVCWRDQTVGSTIIVQRIGHQGNVQWSFPGVSVTPTGDYDNPLIVSDGSGGAIVAWEDSTQGLRQVDLYAQRIGSSGTLLWNPATPVSNAPFEQYVFSIVSRANGGAILAWTDARGWTGQADDSVGLDIYAQSIDSSGVAQWPSTGTPVSSPRAPSFGLSAQSNPALVTDGAGGAIAFWQDNRNSGNGSDIYTQGLAALGLPFRLTIPITQPNTNYPFIINTTPLLNVNFSSLGPVNSMTVEAYLNATPSGLTKALPRYLDLSTNGPGFTATLTLNYTDDEVRAAHLVNGDANLRAYRRNGFLWTLAGGTVDTNANTVTVTGVTEFSQWALRDPSDTVVTGVLGQPGRPYTIFLGQNYPNPFNPSTSIRFSLPASGLATLKVNDILGREVRTLVNENRQAETYETTFDASGLASGVYFCRLSLSTNRDGQVGEFTQTRRLLLLR